VRQLEADEAAENTRLQAIQRLRAVVDAAKAKVLAGISEPMEERAAAPAGTNCWAVVRPKPLRRLDGIEIRAP